MRWKNDGVTAVGSICFPLCIVALLVIAFFSGCGKANITKQDIVGTWRSEDSGRLGLPRITFFEDGECSLAVANARAGAVGVSILRLGRYEIPESGCVVKFDGGSAEVGRGGRLHVKSSCNAYGAEINIDGDFVRKR